jgi:S-DNA-T family DNA segregation ATPase FtsK/SpoIIIE
VLDEIHELFAVFPDAADDAERAIKRLRALNIIFVLATQIPDKSSLPPNIVRCVTIRWALSLGGQMENDMVLGTGAYKSGLSATVYRPKIDAGWGIIKGLEKPGSYRSDVPERGADEGHLRAGRGAARHHRGDRGRTSRRSTPGTCSRTRGRCCCRASRACRGRSSRSAWRRRGRSSTTGITADMVRETLARYDVPTQDVKVGRKNIKGARRTAIDAALHPREIDDEAASG